MSRRFWRKRSFRRVRVLGPRIRIGDGRANEVAIADIRPTQCGAEHDTNQRSHTVAIILRSVTRCLFDSSIARVGRTHYVRCDQHARLLCSGLTDDKRSLGSAVAEPAGGCDGLTLQLVRLPPHSSGRAGDCRGRVALGPFGQKCFRSRRAHPFQGVNYPDLPHLGAGQLASRDRSQLQPRTTLVHPELSGKRTRRQRHC